MSCGSRRERSRPSSAVLAARARRCPRSRARQHPTQAELEAELVCPTCHDDARRVRLAARAADEGLHPRADRGGRDEDPDHRRARRAELGPQVRAVPTKHGFDLLAWLLPFLGDRGRRGRARRAAAWYWSRNRDDADGRRSSSRRRARRSTRSSSAASTRSSPASMLEKLPVAFLAGLVSVITPCVLPLVPGYLSAVSAVDVDRLGERGAGRRVVIASIPFIIGFTIVFVAARRGARRRSRASSRSRARPRSPASRSIVIGLAFVGLIPIPDSARRAGAAAAGAAQGLGRAARRRVRRLRGAVHRHRARLDPRARRLERRRRARRRPAARLLARPRRRVRARRGRVRARDARVPLGAHALRAAARSPPGRR